MKKTVWIAWLLLLTLLTVTGCAGGGQKVAELSEASDKISVSQQQSTVPEGAVSSQATENEGFAILYDFFDHLDLSSPEAFAEGMSSRSDQDYIMQSYEALRDGFEIGEKACVYHENDEYIFAFKAAFPDGRISLQVLPLVMENGVPKAMLEPAMMQKAIGVMEGYACPECNEGITADGGQCSRCGGYGYILRDKDDI